MSTKDLTNSDGVVLHDPKGSLGFLEGNIIACGIRGEGKSFRDKIKTIQILKEAGYDIREIKLDEKTGSINPFDIDFAETTLDEKEEKLRNLLAVIDYDQNFIHHYLKDMSFLDNKPEWKERATAVLQEYACQDVDQEVAQ